MIKKNGMIYTVTNETDNDSLKFIFLNLKADKDDFENKTKLAKCYMNHKKLGVEYSSEVMSMFNKN